MRLETKYELDSELQALEGDGRPNEKILPIHQRDFFILIQDGEIEQVQSVIESCDLDQKIALLDLQDADGATPLHFAAKLKQEEIVSLLIKEGASLATPNHRNTTAIARVLHLPACHKDIVERLDASVSFVKSSKGNKEFVQIDLERVLVGESEKLSDVIYQVAIQGKEKVKAILNHPVSQAFVALQRKRSRLLDTIYVISYLIYVALFTGVCFESGLIEHTHLNFTRVNTSLYEVNSALALPSVLLGITFAFANIVIFLLNLMSLRERLDEDIRKRTLKMFRELGTLVKIGHWIFIAYPAFGNFLVVYAMFAPLTQEAEHLLSIALLFIWSEVIFRFEALGFAKLYVGMLRVVFFRFLKILFIFSPVFIGFSFAFTILFKKKHVIAVPNIFMNVVAMLSGELNTMDLFDEGNEFLWATSQIVFTSFIIASIIFLNLWIGLVVSDTQKLQENAICKQMAVDIGRIRRDERLEKFVRRFFALLAISDRKKMFEQNGCNKLLIALTADLDCDGMIAERVNDRVTADLEKLANTRRKMALEK